MTKRSRLLIAILLAVTPFITLLSNSFAQGNAANNQASQGSGQSAKFRKSRKPVRDSYIVVLKPEMPSEEVEAAANDFLARHGGATRHIYTHTIKGFSIQLPEAAAMAISRDPRVEYVEEDSEVSFDFTSSTTNWNLGRIDQRTGVDLNYYFSNVENGAGVHAYMLDTGLKVTHRDFSGFNGSNNRASADTDLVWWNNTWGDDCHGHGTAVAGILGGNSFGSAKGVRLHAVRIGDCNAWTTTSTATAGVDWITQNRQNPAVVNMSFGFPADPVLGNALEDAIRASIASGITFVAAAGNSNVDLKDTTPARMPEVITVGASDINDSRWALSNFGPGLDLFAPGVQVQSDGIIDGNGDGIFNEPTGLMDGTSLAAPLVAGVAARFLQVVPNAAPAAVQGAIVNSATINAISNPGPGSPNRLLFSELRHAFLGQTIRTVPEFAFSIDSGVDVGPGQWLAMSGIGEIASGVPFSGTNGPQGWNTIENDSSFPMPGSRPYSLTGTLAGQNFYIGTSTAIRHNFSTAQRLTLRTNDNVPGDGSGSFSCKTELWKLLPDARANFVDQIVPDVMLPGQTHTVSIFMQNAGPTAWTAGQQFKLATPGDSMTWGLNRVVVPYDVAPGAFVTFTFNVIAPTVPGTYNFQWRMLQEGVQRFGDATVNRTITVLSWSNEAQFISQTVPGMMYATESYWVTIKMKNTGTTPWPAGSAYRLGSQNLQDNTIWGTNRVELPNTVYPGQEVTFTFEVTAPLKTGSTNFQWRMVQDGVEWFGATTPNVVVAVKQHPCPSC